MIGYWDTVIVTIPEYPICNYYYYLLDYWPIGLVFVTIFTLKFFFTDMILSTNMFQVSDDTRRLPASGLHAVGGAPDAQDAAADPEAGGAAVGFFILGTVARSWAESTRVKGETE